MRKRLILALTLFLISVNGLPARAGADVEEIKQLRTSAVEAQSRGQLDQALGLYGNALRLATRAYGNNSTYVGDLYFDMGMIALGCSKYPKAEAWLQESVRRNPNSVTARMKLAEIYRLKGQQVQARQLAQRVLSKNANSLEAREMMALSYQDEGNVAKATHECARLVAVLDGKVFPNQPVKAAAPILPSIVKPPVPAAPQPVKEPEKAKEPDKPKPAKPNKPAKPAPVAKPVAVVAVAKPPKVKPPKAKPPAKPAKVKEPVEPAVVKPAMATANTYVEGPANARLRSKAEILTPIKNAKPRSTKVEETSPAEEVNPDNPTAVEETEAPKKEPAKPVVKPPPKPPVVRQPPRPRAGLVPPPPPVVPVFPAMMQPPPPPPKPRAVEKPKPVEKPVERHEEKPAASSADDNPDFLLEWADTGKKKK